MNPPATLPQHDLLNWKLRSMLTSHMEWGALKQTRRGSRLLLARSCRECDRYFRRASDVVRHFKSKHGHGDPWIPQVTNVCPVSKLH